MMVECLDLNGHIKPNAKLFYRCTWSDWFQELVSLMFVEDYN